MRRFLALFVAALALASCGDSGPTEEQTIAYIVYGIEDKSTINWYGAFNITLQQTDASPATYEGSATNPDGTKSIVAFKVERLGQCEYDLREYSGTGDKLTQYSRWVADFSKVTAIEEDPSGSDYPMLRGLKRTCVAVGNVMCIERLGPESIGPFRGDPGRARKALEYLHANFCDAPAF